jgi:hypothetical protein
MQGAYIGSNGEVIGIPWQRWWWWPCRYNNSIDQQGQGDDGARPAQARQGQFNVGVTTEGTRKRENG